MEAMCWFPQLNKKVCRESGDFRKQTVSQKIAHNVTVKLAGVYVHVVLQAVQTVKNVGYNAVLTEVPEIFGAEAILMSRAADEATFNKTVDLINNLKDYFIKNDQPAYRGVL